MKEKTAIALEKSIHKWKRNVTAEFVDEILIGVGDCPLCKLFYYKGCLGCPVEARTGKCRCRETPYTEVVELIQRGSQGKPGKELREAMFEELDFLISLREK